MKAILEFELPQESEEHLLALHGAKYSSAVDSVFNWIRQKQKYGDISENESVLLDELRQHLVSELDLDQF